MAFEGLVIPEPRFVAASHESDGTTLVQYEMPSGATGSERIPGHVEKFETYDSDDDPRGTVHIPAGTVVPESTWEERWRAWFGDRAEVMKELRQAVHKLTEMEQEACA